MSAKGVPEAGTTESARAVAEAGMKLSGSVAEVMAHVDSSVAAVYLGVVQAQLVADATAINLLAGELDFRRQIDAVGGERE